MSKPIMFKVRYGFDKMATISVEAGADLERAIYAWIEQVPVTLKDRMVQGKHIISIEPDYHFYTGWYDSYQPTTGDDFKQIERDCPKFDGYIEAYKQRVLGYIHSGNVKAIGTEPPLTIGIVVGEISETASPEIKRLAEAMKV